VFVPASLVIRDLLSHLVAAPGFAGRPPKAIAAIGQATLQKKCHLRLVEMALNRGNLTIFLAFGMGILIFDPRYTENS